MVKSYEKDKIKLQPITLLMGGNSMILNKSDFEVDKKLAWKQAF